MLLAAGSFGGPSGEDSLAVVGERLVRRILDDDAPIVSTPEALVRWNEPSTEDSPCGEYLRLRWALQSLDALARTPIPDAEQMVRSATIGGIAAVRLGEHREARRLFALARGVAPDRVRLWARWAVSCVPPVAARVWAPLDEAETEPTTEPTTAGPTTAPDETVIAAVVDDPATALIAPETAK